MYCRNVQHHNGQYGDVSAVRQRSGHSARDRTRDAHRLRKLPERCASGTRVVRWNGLKRLDTVADRGRSGDMREPAGADGNGRGWGTAMPAGCQERRTNAELLFSSCTSVGAGSVKAAGDAHESDRARWSFPDHRGKIGRASIADEVLILHKSDREAAFSLAIEQNAACRSGAWCPANHLEQRRKAWHSTPKRQAQSISSLRRVRRRDCGRTRDWTCRAPIRKARSHGSSKRSNTWRQEKPNQTENHS